MLNKIKELNNMEEQYTTESVVYFLEYYKAQVVAYADIKELPNYISNEMLTQLDQAISEVKSKHYTKCYMSIKAYIQLYRNYAGGCYTKNKPRVNRYFYEELNPNSAIMLLLNLGLKIVDTNVNVSLKDSFKEFKVTKRVA